MRFFAACLLLCLLAPVISAQPDEAAKQKWESYLSGLYLDPALKQADYDAHAANLLKSIEKEPASYGALIALRRYMELERELSDLRPMYKLLAGYARDDFMGCNAHPCEFADAYVKLAKRYNTSLEWQNVAKRWAGVTQAAFLGPFGDGTASLHDDVFSPEVMLDFNADCEGAYGRVKWQAMKHFNPLDATLSLYSQTRWSGYGYYVATEFASDEDRDCKLMIRVGGPAKVWLNGEPICNADARRATIPKELEFDVRLPRGRSVLLLKVSANADFRVRLFDARGYPVTGVVAMVPGPDTPRMKMKTGKAPNYPETTDLHLAIAYPEVGRKANSPTIEGLAYLVAAEIFEHNELSNRASEAAEHALEALPDEPLVQLAFLDWIEKGSLYSSSERRKLTRSMTDALLEQDPAFVPAIFKKAELLAADERYREAVDLLHGALEHTPAKWRVYLKLAEVFRDAGWRPEREAAIKSALREAPESLPVLQAASDYYSSIGAQDREIAADRKRLALMPGDPGAHLSLANTLARTGEVEESLRHMRALTAADPSSDFLRGRLAEALSANGKLSEALEVYEELAAQTPRPEEPLYQAARACLQLGREEQGVKYLERVLEADPGHHLARRELQRIRGESEDFWSGYTVGWDEAMQHDITREQFPRADSAMILDEVVQFMYEDGSSVSYVHQIRKVLTQEGVDLRGKDVVSGELITARTIQADGTVLEPITQPGGRVEFPGVKIGAYLDVAYLVRADGGPLRTLDGDAYYFQDQNLNEPFAISRWVLITPKDRQLNVVYHNLSPSDEGVTISATPKDERVVHTWDVRNPRMPETERFMPSPLEFIPWIECVHPRDWRDRARKLAEEGLRDIMDTELIREEASQHTATLESQEAFAHALYDWVNSTITTDGDSWNAHQTLKSHAGNRRELFISLCAAAGVYLGFAYVDAAPPYKSAPEESLPRPHWAYPNRDDFDEFYIVILGEDGQDIFVNMDDRLRPFGEIPARRFNAPVIIWRESLYSGPGDYELGHLPGGNREKDRFENHVTIQLAEDGSAKLEGSISIHGERSYALKESMRTTANDELCNDLEAMLAQQFQGFEADECEFPRIGQVGTPLNRGFKGSVRELATKTKEGLSLDLPGEKIGLLLSNLVESRKRESDIVLNFDLVQIDEFRIKAPVGYAFSAVPDDLVYPTAPLVYELKFRVEDGDMVVRRKLVLGPGRFKPVEYSDLVEQVKRITQAENSTLKLVKS